MEINTDLKKNAVNGLVWKFLERTSAQMVSMVVSIILARILLPEDYAVIGIVTIFFAFCNVFITGGLNTALIQNKNVDQKDYSTVLYSSLIVAIVLYITMFFCSPVIARLYKNDLLVSIIRVMGLTFFINAINSVFSAYTSRHLQFKKVFFSTIVGTVISAIVGITMALNGYGAWALVVQQMLNNLINTLMLFFTVKFKLSLEFSFERFKSLFQYGWKLFVASIISVLYDEINPLIVGIKFSSTDLSFYSKGKSFPKIIDSTISSTLTAVLFPVMSKAQDKKQMILNMTRRYIKVSSYIVFPIMIGFFAVSESFVKLVLTEKWIFATPYIQVFAISYMFNIIQIGNLEAIKAIGRSDISLILEVIKKVLYFVVIILFVFFTDTPEKLAVSSIVCTCIALCINTFPNRKLIGYKYRYQMSDVLPNLIIAIIMGGVVLALNQLNISVVSLFCLQIIVGIVVYILLSIITRNENFRYLLEYMRQVLRSRSK